MKFEESSDLVLDATKNYLVYFLLLDGEVVYVGQTTQNLTRPFSHKDKMFNSVAILYVQPNKKVLDRTEEYFIKKYQPKYNNVFNTHDNFEAEKNEYLKLKYSKELKCSGNRIINFFRNKKIYKKIKNNNYNFSDTVEFLLNSDCKVVNYAK